MIDFNSNFEEMSGDIELTGDLVGSVIFSGQL